MKFSLKFEHFQKKTVLIEDSFPKLPTPEKVIR